MDYVAGFLFSPGRDRVLLLEKRRPAWQAGRLNGVGGKVEPGEEPLAAMNREFSEEAGLSGLDWREDAVLRGQGFTVRFYSAFSAAIDDAGAMTDEPLGIYPVSGLHGLPVMENLRFLVPLAPGHVGHRQARRAARRGRAALVRNPGPESPQAPGGTSAPERRERISSPRRPIAAALSVPSSAASSWASRSTARS